jgi:hypothetical protein
MTTKTKTDTKGKGLCRYDSLTRPKFFHGMLLTEEHLRSEQTYHRESLKRVNRHLWGAGVVCGLEVHAGGGTCIKIDPGLALDCQGNVIEVCKPFTLDVANLCDEKYTDGCVPENEEPIKKYLVLRYAEIAADPQAVLTPSDECAPEDTTKCEASRYREGFCVELRDTCPEPDICDPFGAEEGLAPILIKLLSQRGEEYDPQSVLREKAPPCIETPPCPECDCDGDCGVGLATLVINCATRSIDDVLCDCRAYVWSPRMIRWLICRVLGQMNRLGGRFEGLPTADAFAARPLPALWQTSGVVVGRGKGPERPDVEGKGTSREKPPAKGKTPKE